MSATQLRGSAALRAAYGAFLAHEGRVLLTGHSHQAWPDVVRDALGVAFDDAARDVDDKWGRAVFPRVERVGQGILERLGFAQDDPIAFGRSTHELVMRLFSALALGPNTPVVTTGSEFHSLRRQLARLVEAGVPVTWVEGEPREDLADRLLAAIVPGTRVVAFSAVLFEDAYVLPRLGELLQRAQEVGAVALVDAYHGFNAVPLAWGPAAESAFVVAGGYKYAQFGEGICWLRAPRASALRPVDTGWFADFAALEGPRTTGAPPLPVGYGEGGARFAGATFDPTPFYRAEAVLTHFDRFGLDLPTLRAISLAQTAHLIERLDAEGLGERVVTPREASLRGGFVTVRVEGASAVVAALRERGVYVDARGELLRLGPAPYLTDDELARGVHALAQVLR